VIEYRRQDVLRIFGIGERQLRLWERHGLIASAECYGFGELAQLRRLSDLRSRRISAGSIRESVHAMRACSGMAEPLQEAGLAAKGARLVFRHSGTVMEPIAGQFLLDFDGEGNHPVSVVAVPKPSREAVEAEVAGMYITAVRAEEVGRLDEAIDLYQSILELLPGHAAAAINLGTLFYNRHQYARAESLYRMATEADPEYALAFFDLGNVLDELKRVREAIVAYRRALELAPRYADAHYNLALALERSGEPRLALAHWSRYLQLDGTGPWAEHARSQMRRLLAEEHLQIVARGERKVGGSSVEKPRRVL
jgi:tetratricopeptide (TPR) repeat protein